jgi:iron complex outermembrane receptor protein
MKRIIPKNTTSKIIYVALLLLISIKFSYAQNTAVNGKVIDKTGLAIPGASIKIKGTSRATISDQNGNFSISAVPPGDIVLVTSFLGYLSKETIISQSQRATPLSITLSERANEMDEVLVTGVFDKRKRMDASVAISTLTASQMQRIVPASAADLLRNVPGVFVNSSVGEIRNTVTSRGTTVGTQDVGYEYVSMQEDGLPITNTTYYGYTPDYFLRPDATLERLDAVRGGSASITAANAPGGIFNYVSKTGGDTFAGELRAKYGLVGNGDNSLGRIDANFGGPIAKDWTYNIGGFYRYDQGARSPGYAMNVGGQIKANVVKKYSKGSLKFFLKYLNDKNANPQPIPTVGYTNPKPAEGFNGNSTVLPPAYNFSSNDFLNKAGGSIDYNPKNLTKNIYKSLGFAWDHQLGNGWTFNNNARYSDNSTVANFTGANIVTSATDATLPALMLGTIGVGTYSFKNVNTGQELLNVTSNGASYVVNKNNLPGQNILSGGILASPLGYYKNETNEFLDQFSFNKKIKNMTFTLGGYFGYSNVHRYSGTNGLTLSTIEDRPQLISMSLTGAPVYGFTPTNTPILGPAGVYQFTNAQGTGQLTGDLGNMISYNARQTQAALFFGHTWEINQQLTFDWGLRYERVGVKGYNIRGYSKTGVQGGIDGSVFTLYDNNVLDHSTTVNFDKALNSLSFSGALNYKFNENLALYGRYSQGKKAPDLDIYFASNRVETIDLLNPQLRTTRQVEFGLKARSGDLNLFLTPFYSVLSGVPNGAIFGSVATGFYNPPMTYGKYRTIGIEIEANYRLDEHFSFRGVATVQRSKILALDNWVANGDGPADDTIISYTGNETENAPRVMLNLTPTYTAGKFYTFITWSYLGSRQANSANVFKLPGFSQVDLGAGYDVSKKMQLSLNVNNVFNKYGVMSWVRPGSLFDVISGNSSFTSAMYEKAVTTNQPYSTIAILPRAYYLTATYKF